MIISKRLSLAFCVFHAGLGLGVTAAYYLDPLMTNSVDVIIDRLNSVPVGEATMARELSTNMLFRADDIAQYVFTNAFQNLGNYTAIRHRLINMNRAAKLVRYSCNLHRSETNLLLQTQYHERLGDFLESENLLSKSYESEDARWLADCIFRAKFTWPVFGQESMYASIDQSMTNRCDLSLTNSLPAPQREFVAALASSRLFSIRGIDVPMVSLDGKETNSISVVAIARQGKVGHVFLLDFSNCDNATLGNKESIAAKALQLAAINEGIGCRIQSRSNISRRAFSVFADTPAPPTVATSLFKSPFVNGLFCNATNLPSILKRMCFLSADNPDWIASDPSFRMRDYKAKLLESGIPDYIMEPSAHSYITELMIKPPEDIAESLSSFWCHIDRKSLAEELSTNTTFRADEVSIATYGKEIPTNNIEAVIKHINRNIGVSLALSFSCITNYSQEARLAESNYLARISSLVELFDCNGDSGATNPCSQLRRAANNAAYAYHVSRRKDVLGALIDAISNANTYTNGFQTFAAAGPFGEIANAIAALDGFRICATNVPYFNPITGTTDVIDALVCQQGVYRKAFFLLSMKFRNQASMPGKKTVITETGKLTSLCQGVLECAYGGGGDSQIDYIPCLIFDSRPEVSPYEIIHNFIDSRAISLWGDTANITNRLSRLRIVR